MIDRLTHLRYKLKAAEQAKNSAEYHFNKDGIKKAENEIQEIQKAILGIFEKAKTE